MYIYIYIKNVDTTTAVFGHRSSEKHPFPPDHGRRNRCAALTLIIAKPLGMRPFSHYFDQYFDQLLQLKKLNTMYQ